jgi:hypothetical protein
MLRCAPPSQQLKLRWEVAAEERSVGCCFIPSGDPITANEGWQGWDIVYRATQAWPAELADPAGMFRNLALY